MSPVCGLATCAALVQSKGGLCSQCREVNYCCKEHQRSDWRRHKAECKAAAAARAPSGSKETPNKFREPDPCSWAAGLDAHMQREWLADCYRMRLDDEYSWQGSVRSGSLYDGSEAREIAQDFLVFCRLAQDRSVIPSSWSWSQFLKVASEHLVSAFEKSDAREKYGGENIFTPMMGGRRSLR